MKNPRATPRKNGEGARSQALVLTMTSKSGLVYSICALVKSAKVSSRQINQLKPPLVLSVGLIFVQHTMRYGF